MSKEKPDTIAVSAGRMTREHFGVVNTPVYRTSTILHPSLESMKGEALPYKYGRRGTPSSRSFESAIEALEGGARCVAVPSGLNAIATAIMAVCNAGDHLLMTDSCYGPTRLFCDKTLKRFGVETEYYDPLIGGGIAALLRPNTRAVYCESPGSLTFEIQDVPAIAAAAHAKEVSVLLDNTWATPVFFRALDYGVDLSIMSGTKYINGHADVMVGTITANESHRKRLEAFYGDTGLFLGGDDTYLSLRGVRTLAVRLKRHEENALALTRWLTTRPEVARVLYPALESDPGHAIWKRDFSGSSGLFGVELKPVSKSALSAFFNGFAHFGLGYSWGGFESLIIPADFKRTATKFQCDGPLIRLHAGLEAAEDLIADLEAGFARMREGA
ncbi:MAG: cystathionine beta-lyase [Alphaproteobacteria bacterium]|nr:cystathionine beta-lyase [Alphaproteobacteria bacterium]MBV9692573.1 cystathionine beta-lyase [Alphaproteobacteria bacterium]